MPFPIYKVNRFKEWKEAKFFVDLRTENYSFNECDALLPKYDNEGKEYTNPLEAAKLAIDIYKRWFDYIFDRFPLASVVRLKWDGEKMDEQEMLAKATELYNRIVKCSNCSGFIKTGGQKEDFDYPDLRFCSEKCLDSFDFDVY